MDLVAEIVADKAAGTRRLVSEYGNRLYETAIRLCGNEADAAVRGNVAGRGVRLVRGMRRGDFLPVSEMPAISRMLKQDC